MTYIRVGCFVSTPYDSPQGLVSNRLGTPKQTPSNPSLKIEFLY